MSDSQPDLSEGLPIVRCPSCRFEMIDGDGFGFYFCPECRYCTHPNAERLGDGRKRCLICGVIHQS